jgi:hypothetical protein
VLTAAALANLALLLLVILVPSYTDQSISTRQSCSYKMVPCHFVVVLLMLCLGSFGFFPCNTHGFAFTSQHNLTSAHNNHHCWVDSACTKSIFRSKNLLINVRKLKTPHSVAGMGGSIITAHWQGDYPLILRGPSGRTRLKLIKNVLISPDTSANLLGTNCLNAADVGFYAPPAWTRVSAKLYIQDRDSTSEDFKLPHINCLWSVPDFDTVGFAEFPQALYTAFQAKNSSSVASRPHQLRALMESELRHHRLNHAHPTKLAKLSCNCIGITHPLPDVRHPCHLCQDSNATRNDAPPPSTADHEGVWHVDVMDLGDKHTSMAGYRYISIFTIAKSRFVIIELHKTNDAFLPAIQRAITCVGQKPTMLRSDCAGKYFAEPVNCYLLQ